MAPVTVVWCALMHGFLLTSPALAATPARPTHLTTAARSDTTRGHPSGYRVLLGGGDLEQSTGDDHGGPAAKRAKRQSGNSRPNSARNGNGNLNGNTVGNGSSTGNNVGNGNSNGSSVGNGIGAVQATTSRPPVTAGPWWSTAGDGWTLADCLRPVGLESRFIPDSAFTASSERASQGLGASAARLNNAAGSWSPQHDRLGEFLQVDLGVTFHISGLVVQGSPAGNAWVTEFQVTVLKAGGQLWTPLGANGSNQAFPGNVDGATESRLLFNTSVAVSGARVLPLSWHGSIALRLELLACSKPLETPALDYTPVNLNGRVQITVGALPAGPVCSRWDMGNGDNLILGPSFCRSRCPSCQNQTLDYTSGAFQYNYKKYGAFAAAVNLTNAFSSAGGSVNVSVNRYGCKLGPVTIQDDAKSLATARLVFVTDSLSLSVDAARSCIVVGMRMRLAWTATQVNGTRSYAGTSGTLAVNFAPAQFVPGTYRLVVTMTISLAGVESVSEPVFLRVEEAPLDVELSGGHYRLVGEGADVLVEAVSSSGRPAAAVGVTFDWFCKKNASEPFLTINASACAGARVVGRGMLRLPAASVVAKTVFYLRLVASNGARVEAYEQVVNVTRGSILDVSIRCLENCNEKIDPTSGLFVVAQCSNCVRGEAVSFSWSLRQLNATTGTYNIDRSSVTQQRGIGLRVAANDLAEAQQYQITVEAVGTQGQIGESKLLTSTTRPPYGGSCDVTPTSGAALTTNFDVSCPGWVSGDATSDLRYRVVVPGGAGKPPLVVSSSGARDSGALLLPAGGAGGAGGDLNVSVFVCSQSGSCTEFPVTIQVSALSPEKLEATLNEMLSPGGTLQTLVADQDYQKALHMVHVLSASLGNVTSPGLKQQHIYSLLQITRNTSSQISTAEDATEVMNAVHELTSDRQYLDLNSQVVAANIVERVTFSLKNNSGISRDDLMSISPVVVGVVADLVGTSSDRVSAAAEVLDADYSPDSLDMNPQEADRFRKQQSDAFYSQLGQQSLQMTQVADSSATAMDDLSAMILGAMMFGEEPLTVASNNLSVTVGLNTLGSVEDARWDSGSTSTTTTFTNVSSQMLLETTSVQVRSFEQNPYVWDASSRINSAVVQLSVSALPNASDAGASVAVRLPNRAAGAPVPMAVPNCTAPGCLSISKFQIDAPGSAILLGFSPPTTSGLGLEVFLKLNGTPAAQPPDYDFRFVLPRSLAGDAAGGGGGGADRRYTVFVPGGSVGVGVYFIGLRTTDNFTGASGSKTKRALADNVTASMTVSLHRLTCKMWNPEQNIWTTDVAQVLPDSSAEETVCGATLPAVALAGATFAAEFFVPPNTIDFSTVFALFDLKNNAAVFSAVVCVTLLYLLLLLYARRADRRDVDNWKIRPLVDNADEHTYVYLLSVVTGMRAGAGTRSRVYFTVHFSLGDTGVRILHNGHLKGFCRESTVTFEMTVPGYRGEPRSVTVWHDNSGRGEHGSWFLRHILLHDLHANQTFLFPCDRWLAVEFDDGQLCRNLPVAGFQFVPSTGKVFASTVQSKITDDHMWVSVFLRPTRSAFSRVQRVSCCVSLLFLTMITNAMWFEQGPSTGSGDVHIGPFTLSLSEMLTGLLSNLIVFPVSFVIVAVFRRQTFRPGTLRFFERHAGRERDAGAGGGRGPSRGGPRCRVVASTLYKCVAWALVVLSVLTSGFFTILYSMEWGPEKADRWLRVFIMSFFQSLVIIQPVKVVCIAFFVSLLLKKKRKLLHDDGTLELFKDKADKLDWPESDPCEPPGRAAALPDADYLPGPPTGEALAAMRRERVGERAAWRRVTGLGLFAARAALLAFVVYRGRDPAAFRVRSSVSGMFVAGGLDQVTDIGSFWDWMQSGFLPNLYPVAWYNGDKMSWRERYYLGDASTLRVGPARLRQIRSAPRSVSDVMGLPYEASGDGAEATGSFLPGWQSADSANASSQADYWSYSSAQALQGVASTGNIATYPGGGYVAELGLNLADGAAIVAELSSASWLDRGTRAVLTEFTGYNVNCDLFCCVTFFLEFPGTGGTSWHADIHVFRMDGLVGDADMATGAAVIAFAAVLALGAAAEALRLSRLGAAYFAGFWNLVELLSVALGAAVVVTYFVKMSAAARALATFRADPHKFVNFQELVEWDRQLSDLLAFLTFVVTVKSLSHLEGLGRFEPLVGAFSEARDDIQGFAAIIAVIFCAFALLANLLFGGLLRNYHTVSSCLEQLFSLLLGQPGYGELYAANRVAGPLVYFAFTFVNAFVVVNFLLGILAAGSEKFRQGEREREPRPRTGLLEVLAKRVRAALPAAPTALRRLFKAG